MSQVIAEPAWGRRWISGLERLATAWQNRLPRGRDYAQKGHVVSLSVVPGRISAKVQGSRSKPYTTTIDVPVLRESEWTEVTRQLVKEARFAADLLAGRMPEGIEQLFAARGAGLFPVRNSEMIGTCNCPDKARPCKHIAAIHYGFGEALDRDPFLLLQLRGADRRALLRTMRKLWLGNEGQGADIDDEDEQTAERGLPVIPLLADRFNRSPDTVEVMSFSMRPAEEPLFILERLGAPSSWSLPLNILQLLGPVYEDSARRAIEIALAEIRAEDAAWGADEDDDSDDWGDESELDDDDDEDDDGDGDDEDDDDGEDEGEERAAAVPPTPDVRFRALDFSSPPLPGAISGRFGDLDDDIGAAPAFVLPKSLSRIAAPVAVVPPSPSVEDDPESGGVLIRKGVAALNRTRRKHRTTGSLQAVSDLDTQREPTPPPLMVVPTPVAAGSAFTTDVGRTAAVDPRIKGRGGRAKGGRPEPVVETVVRTRGRAVDTPIAPEPVASSRSGTVMPPPLVRRVAPPSGPAQAPPVAPPVVARRAGARADTGVPALAPRSAARELDQAARRAFEAGLGAAALEAARGAWRADPTEPRYLMLMAAADLAGQQVEAVDAEAEFLLDRAPEQLRTAELLLLLTAGRTMVVADLLDGAGTSAWDGPDSAGEVFVPFAMVAAADGAELSGSKSLLKVWNRLVQRGQNAFPDLEEPPAPVGAWLDWSLADHPPTAEERGRLLSLALGMVVDLLGAHRTVGSDGDPRQAQVWVLAAVEAMRLCDRDGEIPPFVSMVRRAAAPQARLLRAIETALLDAEIE